MICFPACCSPACRGCSCAWLVLDALVGALGCDTPRGVRGLGSEWAAALVLGFEKCCCFRASLRSELSCCLQLEVDVFVSPVCALESWLCVRREALLQLCCGRAGAPPSLSQNKQHHQTKTYIASLVCEISCIYYIFY